MKLKLLLSVIVGTTAVAMQPVQPRAGAPKSSEEVLKKDFLEKVETCVNNCPVVCSPIAVGAIIASSLSRYIYWQSTCGKYSMPEYMNNNFKKCDDARGTDLDGICPKSVDTVLKDPNFIKCHEFLGVYVDPVNGTVSDMWASRETEFSLNMLEMAVSAGTAFGTVACLLADSKLRNRNVARRTKRQQEYAKYLRDEFPQDTKKTN